MWYHAMVWQVEQIVEEEEVQQETPAPVEEIKQ
jgi:hypothetical protein